MMLEALFPWTAVALAAVATGLSLFLSVKTLVGGRLPGCGPGSACDSVTTSRWARWWRIPVALPATLLYLSIFVLILLHHHAPTPPVHTRIVLTGLSVVAIGGATWFVIIQAFVLHRFCVWCMIDHVAGLAASSIVLHEVWPEVQSAPGFAPLIAVILLAVLIVGQLLFEPKTYEVQKSDEVARVAPPMAPLSDAPLEVPADSSVREAPASLETAPPPHPPLSPGPSAVAAPVHSQPTNATGTTHPRTLALLEGRLQISTATFPLLGRTGATHVLIDMFDYTCEHCRELHHYLHDARRHFQDRLAILAVPLPMDSACNPVVQSTNPKHVGACAYVRCALAVWNADPTKFEPFHDWLFAPPRPPGADRARAHAEQLVGKDAFRAALAGPAVETNIGSAIGLYKFLGAGQIPKLVMNRGVLVGEVPSAQRLTELLEQDFSPKPAQPVQVTASFIGGFR